MEEELLFALTQPYQCIIIEDDHLDRQSTIYKIVSLLIATTADPMGLLTAVVMPSQTMAKSFSRNFSAFLGFPETDAAIVDFVNEKFKNIYLPSLCGFQVPYEQHNINSTTKCLFTTAEHLTRTYLFQDPLFEKFGFVLLVLDRSIYSDLLLALLRKIMLKNKKLQLILFMNSTAVLPVRLMNYFEGISITTSFMRNSSSLMKKQLCQIFYLCEEPSDGGLESAFQSCLQICKSKSDKIKASNILVLFPSREDVTRLETMLQMEFLKDYDVVPFYLKDTFDLKKRWKIYLNVQYKDSLSDIGYVIDSGIYKCIIYDEFLKAERLVTLPISKMEANWRAALLNGPGALYRLYSKATFLKMRDYSVPDIQLSELTKPLLLTKALGIQHVSSLDLLDPPSISMLKVAEKLLLKLGFLSLEGAILVPFGDFAATLNLSPRLVAAIIKAHGLSCSKELVMIASIYSLESLPYYKPTTNTNIWKFTAEEGDPLTLLNVFLSFLRAENRAKFCEKNGLSFDLLQRANSIFGQLTHSFAQLGFTPLKSCFDTDILAADNIRTALLFAYYDHVAIANPDGSYRPLLIPNNDCRRTIKETSAANASEISFYIHPESTLFKRSHPLPKYIQYMKLIHTTKYFCIGCSTIDPLWLPQLHPDVYSKRISISKLY